MHSTQSPYAKSNSNITHKFFGAIFAPYSVESGQEHFRLPKHDHTSDLIDVYLPIWLKQKKIGGGKTVAGVHDETKHQIGVTFYEVKHGGIVSHTGRFLLHIAIPVFLTSQEMNQRTAWYQRANDEEDLYSIVMYKILNRNIEEPEEFRASMGRTQNGQPLDPGCHTLLKHFKNMKHHPMDRLQQMLYSKLTLYFESEHNLTFATIAMEGCLLLMQSLALHQLRHPLPKTRLQTKCLLTIALELTLQHSPGSPAFGAQYESLKNKLPTILFKTLAAMVKVMNGYGH